MCTLREKLDGLIHILCTYQWQKYGFVRVFHEIQRFEGVSSVHFGVGWGPAVSEVVRLENRLSDTEYLFQEKKKENLLRIPHVGGAIGRTGYLTWKSD